MLKKNQLKNNIGLVSVCDEYDLLENDTDRSLHLLDCNICDLCYMCLGDWKLEDSDMCNDCLRESLMED